MTNTLPWYRWPIEIDGLTYLVIFHGYLPAIWMFEAPRWWSKAIYGLYMCVYNYICIVYIYWLYVYNIYIGNGTVSFSFMSISPSFTRQHYSTPRVPALLASLPRRRSSDEGAIGPWAMGLEISCFGGCIHVPSHQSGQIITTSLRPSPVESWLIREIIPKWP